ncbi:MAG: hypothetical protein KF774_09105 [Planctomyces sp.]|nr:hypothetical protein [Planctomyces sp.]
MKSEDILLHLLIFGLIAAVCGQSKGWKTAPSFFVGFVLGPVGVLITLIGGRNEAVLERMAIESRQRKRCRSCGELIRMEAVKCRHCGEPVAAETA